MSHQLHVRLLGDFRLVYGEQSVTRVDTARQQALLTYLLIHRHAPQPRQQLAFLFWPDSSEAQARANLRHLLHQLRHTLPNADHYLQLEDQSVQWRPDAPFTCDLVAFDRCWLQAQSAQAHGRTEDVRLALVAAVEHYGGDLLPACYDDWILPVREQGRAKFIQVLEQLITLFETDQEYATALGYAQRLLQHDPLHESIYRHLMRLYALQGDRASALRSYHTCVTVLQRELGVDPHPATQEAYRRLLNQETLTASVSPAPQRVGSAQLIGRQAEWTQLQTAWRKAAQGHAHFVWVTGEAGIGKTRLVEELRHWAEQQGIATAHTRSYAAEGDLAYAPVSEWLRSAVFQAALPQLPAVWLREVARVLPEILTQHPQLAPPAPLQARWQRQRLFEALARAVLLVKPPLLLTLDDLQWCDQETLEWLHYLLRFDPHARLLLVGTARAEEMGTEQPLATLLLALQRNDHVTEIPLGPLSPVETGRLAVQAAGQALAAATLARLVQFTAGNPLFVVETVRAQNSAGLLENSPTPGSALAGLERQALPPKIHAVIQQRFQQLSPPAREIAKLAAVSGRSFTFALLAQASELNEATLAGGLDELWQRRIVREQSGETYDFTHDRLRDGAYAAISPMQRRYLHGRLAQALEQLYAADLDPVSAQLAVHYEQAGLVEQAIACYERAATVAAQVFSYANAIAYLDAALRLLKGQPQTVANIRQAVTLQLHKAHSIDVHQGFTGAAIAELCTELEALLPQLTDDRLAFEARQRLAGFYRAVGQVERGYQQANKLLTLAQRIAEPVYQLRTCQSAGIANLQLGYFALARRHLAQGVDHYQTSAAHSSAQAGRDGAINAILSNLTFTLWLLGHPEQAIAQQATLVSFIEKLGDPWQASIAHFFVTMLNSYLYDATATATAAERMLALDGQYGIPLNRSSGLVALGWAWVLQGRRHEGIAQMRAGIDEMKAMNHAMFQTHRLAWLVEAQLQVGDWAAAATTLDEAFAMSEQSGQRSCDVELYRLRGEWLVQSAVTSPESQVRSQELAAETAFWQAITLARTQEAKSFELRAVMGLCRLWQRQGKQAEARQLLAEIYGWFTEGFATADLLAAKALLTALTEKQEAT